MSWQTIRDFLLAALVAALTAGIDYATAFVESHPLAFAAFTPFILVILSVARRWLNPTIPLAEAWSYDDRVTIPASFAPAPDLDDDAFLQSVALQVSAYTPARNGVKKFDVSIIALIVLRLVLENVDLEALVEKAKQWLLGLLARIRLRRAIAAAAAREGQQPNEVAIDGMQEWLFKSDRGVLSRLRMIAESRRK